MSSADLSNQLLPADIEEKMIGVRRHLHTHPELSNQEKATQAFLRAQLETEGIQGIHDVAGYGLAVDIAGTRGASNRKLVVRADIDALPIHEESGVAFSSVTPGVMHACGHDAHAAMGYALAVLLNRQKHFFAGTVRVIFQPAEEAEPLGGRRVVEEGLLDDVEAAIGIHVDPYTETGKIGVAPGPYSLACDIFDLVVTGASAHAAKPYEGVDAIAVASTMVSDIQKIVAREIDPYDPLVITITGFEAGTGAYNVIAEKAKLKGTIRSGNDATREHAWRRLREIVASIAHAHRATADITIQRGEPAIQNNVAMVGLICRAGAEILGDQNVLAIPGWAVADDFAFYSEKRPSVYFRLGIKNPEVGSTYPLHHPRFRVDEAALANGAAIICRAATSFLATPLELR